MISTKQSSSITQYIMGNDTEILQEYSDKRRRVHTTEKEKSTRKSIVDLEKKKRRTEHINTVVRKLRAKQAEKNLELSSLPTSCNALNSDEGAVG